MTWPSLLRIISFLPKDVWSQILDVRRFVLNWVIGIDEALELPASELGAGVVSGDVVITESWVLECEEAMVQ